jgi:hypothetical protein
MCNFKGVVKKKGKKGFFFIFIFKEFGVNMGLWGLAFMTQLGDITVKLSFLGIWLTGCYWGN